MATTANDDRSMVACMGCGAWLDITPGSDTPDDGSAYRTLRCACGLVYEYGRQDGQGYLFLDPTSVRQGDEAWEEEQG